MSDTSTNNSSIDVSTDKKWSIESLADSCGANLNNEADKSFMTTIQKSLAENDLTDIVLDLVAGQYHTKHFMNWTKQSLITVDQNYDVLQGSLQEIASKVQDLSQNLPHELQKLLNKVMRAEMDIFEKRILNKIKDTQYQVQQTNNFTYSSDKQDIIPSDMAEKIPLQEKNLELTNSRLEILNEPQNCPLEQNPPTNNDTQYPKHTNKPNKNLSWRREQKNVTVKNKIHNHINNNNKLYNNKMNARGGRGGRGRGGFIPSEQTVTITRQQIQNLIGNQEQDQTIVVQFGKLQVNRRCTRCGSESHVRKGCIVKFSCQYCHRDHPDFECRWHIKVMKRTCQICGIFGHRANKCRENNRKFYDACQLCKSMEHKAPNCTAICIKPNGLRFMLPEPNQPNMNNMNIDQDNQPQQNNLQIQPQNQNQNQI
jgi:hypothetical protein